MGSHRIGHNLVTEQQENYQLSVCVCVCVCVCVVGAVGEVGRIKLDVYIWDSDMLPLTHLSQIESPIFSVPRLLPS